MSMLGIATRVNSGRQYGVLPCHSIISELALSACTVTSVGSRQSLVKSFQCACEDFE